MALYLSHPCGAGLLQALDELAQEGGIPARSRRYAENNRLLIEKMRAMGFATYIDGSHQGPIITTFFYPAGVSFRFEEFYRYIKERGYAIYPGKLTEMDTFRIGNIGEIYPEDIDKLDRHHCSLPEGEKGADRMIEAVIFDWAGTTVDYGCFAPVQAFMEAFAHHGVPVTMEETRKPMGMLKRDHIRTMLHMERIAAEWKRVHGHEATEEAVDAVYAQFEPKAVLHSGPGYAAPKPFAVETAAKLREMGVKIGSTTGYTDAMMNIVAPKAAQQGYAPDFWISPDGVGARAAPTPT